MNSSPRRRRERWMRLTVIIVGLLTVLGLVLSLLPTMPARAAERDIAVTHTAALPAAQGLNGAQVGAQAGGINERILAQAGTAQPSAPTPSAETPLVFIGVSDLTWADVVSTARDPQPVASDTGPDAVLSQTAARWLLDAVDAGALPANLVTRTVGGPTCPLDGWMTLGAGQQMRAGATPTRDASGGIECPTVESWQQITQANTAAFAQGHAGALSVALDAAGVDTATVGAGAALAMSRPPADAEQSRTPLSSGLSVAEFLSDRAAQAPLHSLTLMDAQVAPAAGRDRTSPVATLAQLGRILESLDAQLSAGTVRVAVASLAAPADARLQLALLPPGSTSTRGMTGSVASGTALLTGPGTHRAGLIETAELTRALAQAAAPQASQRVLRDLPDSGLRIPGVDAPVMTAQEQADSPRAAVEKPSAVRLPSWSESAQATQRMVTETNREALAAHSWNVSHLIDEATHSSASEKAKVPVGALLVLTCLLVLGVCLPMLSVRRERSSSRRLRLGLIYLCAWAAALPASVWLTNLLPWWRVGTDDATGMPTVVTTVAAVALVVVGAAVCAAAAWLAAWPAALAGRHASLAMAIVASGTAILIVGDAATGAHLSFANTLGMNAVVAGRFYGMANTPFAIAAGAGLVAIGALWAATGGARGPRRLRTLSITVASFAAAALFLLDALPMAGADLGGSLTLIPTLTVLIALLGQRAELWSLPARRWGFWLRWGGLLLVATAVLTAAVASADYLLAGGPHTHLGRFAQSVAEGTWQPVVMRKAYALVAPFLRSWLAVAALIGLLLVAGLVILWWRRQRAQLRGRGDDSGWQWMSTLPSWWTPVLWSALMLCAVETLTNDSGITMAMMTAATLTPVMLGAALPNAAPALPPQDDPDAAEEPDPLPVLGPGENPPGVDSAQAAAAPQLSDSASLQLPDSAASPDAPAQPLASPAESSADSSPRTAPTRATEAVPPSPLPRATEDAPSADTPTEDAPSPLAGGTAEDTPPETAGM